MRLELYRIGAKGFVDRRIDRRQACCEAWSGHDFMRHVRIEDIQGSCWMVAYTRFYLYLLEILISKKTMIFGYVTTDSQNTSNQKF